MGILLFLIACAPAKPDTSNGWREIPSPRPDLQCWVRYNVTGSEVCAPSLTSTHGASQ